MILSGWILFAALVGSAALSTRKHLKDHEGNVTAKPMPWAWMSLALGLFYLSEYVLELRSGYVQAPDGNYFMRALCLIGVVMFFLIRKWHVTMTPTHLIEHIPLLSRQRILLSDLVALQETDTAFIVRSSGQRKIAILKTFSGAPGLALSLRNTHPSLTHTNVA